MPTVQVDERISAPIAEVWRVVCDVRSYPDRMDPVRAVEIVEETDDELVTAWEVELKGSILKWVERERRYPDRYRIEYSQLDGDLELFEGFWQLEELGPNETRASLIVDFEIGIPMLREMLDPVAARAIRENSRTMLLSLGSEPVGLAD